MTKDKQQEFETSFITSIEEESPAIISAAVKMTTEEYARAWMLSIAKRKHGEEGTEARFGQTQDHEADHSGSS